VLLFHRDGKQVAIAAQREWRSFLQKYSALFDLKAKRRTRILKVVAVVKIRCGIKLVYAYF
jgi:hypothetical protein